MRAGLEYDVGTVSPTTGKSLTFGRRYGARFILRLGEVSGGTLVLLHMGGYNLVPSADNVADGGPGGSRIRATARRAVGLPARDLWLGVTPQRRGGWGCPAPSAPAPIEVTPRWGSLPATSRERGSASGLRWPWCNRKRASDMRDQSRVRPNDHFVSGDPQSEPDTQDLPPTPAFGAQNGSPDGRLERHHGEDVGGRDAIGVRLRLGDNPVADSAADTRAVTTGGTALRHHAAPTRGKGGGAPMRDLLGSAILGGIEGGAEAIPSPARGYTGGKLA